MIVFFKAGKTANEVMVLADEVKRVGVDFDEMLREKVLAGSSKDSGDAGKADKPGHAQQRPGD